MSPHALAGTVAEAPPSSWRSWFAFAGPATLVSVGYMDPGNWASDLEGGSAFGYTLLWVLVAASAVATFLQHLAGKLGIASGLDLAEACRAYYPRRVAFTLWVLCQIAIIACDLAEVIGSAVAINLLFGLPILWGAVITVGDVFLVLLLQHRGIRRLEAIVGVLVATVAVCLGLELVLAQPQWSQVLTGLRPTLTADQLYVAVAILGATVMPHNLYLHSALVKTRRVAPDAPSRGRAIRTSLLNTFVALNLALLVNAAILIVAADVFHPAQIVVKDLREAQQLLVPLLGVTAAAVLFAIGLLAAGQSATITGTMAGQIVALGFLGLRSGPVLMRLGTRLAAIVPAVVAIAIFGEQSTITLLIATQVVLSLQLPFAVVPLLRITNSAAAMGPFANPRAVRYVGALIASFLTAINLALAWHTAQDTGWVAMAVIACAGALALLAYLAFAPLRRPTEAAQAFAAVLAPSLAVALGSSSNRNGGRSG